MNFRERIPCLIERFGLPSLILLAALPLANASGGTAAPQSNGVLKQDPGLDAALARAIRGFDRVAKSGTFRASQPSQGYAAELSSTGGLTLSLGNDRISLHAMGFGRGSSVQTPTSATTTLSQDASGWPQVGFARQNLSEWYVNEEDGLHHWMRVQNRPSSASTVSPLWVRLGLSNATKVRSISDDAVEVQTGSHVLSYSGLHAWDAKGNELSARIRVSGQNLEVMVDDRDATYPVTIDPIWSQQQKVTAPDAISKDGLGYSVALSGDTAVVGAFSNNNLNSSAYVFDRLAGAWSYRQKLTFQTPYLPEFGSSVAISGDTIVVGGATNKNDIPGYAIVFNRLGGVWNQQAALKPADGLPGDQFGVSVAISNDTVVVGSYLNGGAKGAAYVFTRSGVVWSFQQKLTATDGLKYDWFGFSVALSGDTAVIGAYNKGYGLGKPTGSAYVFTRSNGLIPKWTLQQQLSASDGVVGDQFGYAVSVDGDTALIGAPQKATGTGAAYLFARSAGAWTQSNKLVATDGKPQDWFGFATSVSNGVALVGGYGQAKAKGSAYVFAQYGPTWIQEAKLAASDGGAGDTYGFSVSASGNTGIVGAPSKLLGRGAAYAFYRNWVPSLKLAPVTITGGTALESVGTVTLAAAAPAGGAVVLLSSDTPAVALPDVPSITIKAGAKTGTFTIKPFSVTATSTAKISATYLYGTASATLTVVSKPILNGFKIAPTLITGGGSTTPVIGTVQLSKEAPTGGVVVSVVSDSPTVAIPATPTFTIPYGVTIGTFKINAFSVAKLSTVNFSVSYDGAVQKAQLQVQPILATLSVAPTLVTGGDGSTPVGTVTLSDTMLQDETVQLSTTSPSVVFADPSNTVVVPKGQTSATFKIKTLEVTTLTNVPVMASLDGFSASSSQLNLDVFPTLVSTTIDRLKFIGGDLQEPVVTVTLSTGAPATGATINLEADRPMIAKAEIAQFTVPPHQKVATFNIKSFRQTATLTADLTARYRTNLELVTVNVVPVSVTQTLSDQSIHVRGTITDTVSIPAPAGPNGVVISLKSSASNLVILDPVLGTEISTVTIPAGKLTAPVTLQSLGSLNENTTILASVVIGTYRATNVVTLPVNIPVLKDFSLSPTAVTGGTASTLTITLEKPAPGGGVTVNLRSGIPGVASVQPSVFIPSGQTTTTVQITTVAPGNGPLTVTITGWISFDPPEMKKSTNLTVN